MKNKRKRKKKKVGAFRTNRNKQFRPSSLAKRKQNY
jgi:hypothetical protein